MRIESPKDLPIINIHHLVNGQDDIKVAKEIKRACTEFGFFYISDHGIDRNLQTELEEVSKRFFDLDQSQKMRIHMALGGKAWRGYFPLKNELTSGEPDLKEGIYFGSELPPDHPKVKRGLILHGSNQFPEEMTQMRKVVLEYMDRLTNLGHALMRGLSISLGLDANYINEKLTSDPLILFRIFHYPGVQLNDPQNRLWGVGEHTDYGLLTILKQDEVGGLQVKIQDSWVEAPYRPDTFICNIGDMLDKLTGGFYRSTPHRVMNRSTISRFSFPFFFDPGFDEVLQPIPISRDNYDYDNSQARWDGTDIHSFSGTYGDYITEKIGKVFPDLADEV